MKQAISILFATAAIFALAGPAMATGRSAPETAQCLKVAVLIGRSHSGTGYCCVKREKDKCIKKDDNGKCIKWNYKCTKWVKPPCRQRW